MTSIHDLIGLSLQDTVLLDFLNDLDPSYDTIREEHKYSDCMYWNFKSHGISLCFKPVDKPVLDSIHIFDSVNKYNRYKGKLPNNITLDQNNVEIVTQFGEPDKKGGNNVPVWISYEKHEKCLTNKNGKHVGIQFEFKNKSFDDRDNKINTITFFEA